MNRRKFLETTGLVTTSLWVPGFLKSAEDLIKQKINGKRLVIVQLSGGNDGLNTVIPYSNDIYYKLRPGIGILRKDAISINDSAGFNPSMKGMAKLLDKGWLSILNSVGYPNPDRSHFRSMDIWQTGSGSNQNWNTGWIGRLMDSFAKEIHHSHWAIEVDQQLSLAMKGNSKSGFAVKNPKKLNQFAKSITEESFSSAQLQNSELAFLIQTLADTRSTAGYLAEKSDKTTTRKSYPETDLGKSLNMVSSFILGGADSRVYYTSTSGFDTHVRQSIQHGRLLGQVSDALWAFASDLHQADELKNTVILVFSEFGRRAKQNASGGTDHGTAGNVFLITDSPKKQGLFNAMPTLTNLVNDDLVHDVDFREIYASLIDTLFEIDHQMILMSKFGTLPII
jgi:uncharacterized protein (DUF1501 family)